MADTKKLDSVIQIDGEQYEIIAKTAEKVAVPLTIKVVNGTTENYTYDGSNDPAIEIKAVDHSESASKVDNALTIKESSESAITFDGSTPQTIDLTPYALKIVKITAGDGLTGGGDLTSNRTLTVGAGNGITVTADAVAAKAGNGITVDASGIHHTVPTNVAASVKANENERKYITGVTLDTYGHVTGLTTGTETVIDTNTTYDLAASTSSTDGNVKLNLTAGGSGTGTDSVTIKGSGATTVTTDANGNIIVSSPSSATASIAGLVKVSSVNTSTVNVNTESTTVGRYYPVELNNDGKAIVNVPWETYTSLKNPNALTVKGNGTDLFGYDGSAAKSLNITGSGGTSVTANTNGNITISSKNITVSEAEPSGGNAGDIWFKY